MGPADQPRKRGLLPGPGRLAPRFNRAAADQPRKIIRRSVGIGTACSFNAAAANQPRKINSTTQREDGGVASMGPRLMSRGKTPSTARSTLATSCFNEAATEQRGKDGLTGFNRAAANQPRKWSSCWE